MFIGERPWNKVKWGKEGGSDSSSARSRRRSASGRLFAATNTLRVALDEGKAGVAGKIAGSDSVIKTILFYFYERLVDDHVGQASWRRRRRRGRSRRGGARPSGGTTGRASLAEAARCTLRGRTHVINATNLRVNN